MTTTTLKEPSTRGSSAGTAAREQRRRRPGRIRRAGLPYLLLLPALLLELLVHLVPMVIGIVMSFKELTQFYIRDWGSAPWSGLGNYRVSVDFDAPVGQALLHSFFVTVGFTLLSVALCWLIGTAAAVYMQDTTSWSTACSKPVSLPPSPSTTGTFRRYSRTAAAGRSGTRRSRSPSTPPSWPSASPTG